MTAWLLAIDTATRQATVAIGAPDGALRAGRDWPAGHRHAETLLPALRDLLAGLGLRPADLGGVVVGTGPGSFTGLRVGLATAKTLAHGLRIPIAGIATPDALAAAALGRIAGEALVLLPAGPTDRYLACVHVAADGSVRAIGAPRLVAPPDVDEAVAQAVTRGARIIAVDTSDEHLVPGSAEAAGVTRGREALVGLGAALLRLGAAALGAGRADAVDALVPTYVTLPRGVVTVESGTAWSPDLR